MNRSLARRVYRRQFEDQLAEHSRERERRMELTWKRSIVARFSQSATTTILPLALVASNAASNAFWFPAHSNAISTPLPPVALRISSTTLTLIGLKTESAPQERAISVLIGDGSEMKTLEHPLALSTLCMEKIRSTFWGRKTKQI